MKRRTRDREAEVRTQKRNPYPDNMAAFLFLLPCMIGFVVFVAIPVLVSLGLSFAEWNFLGGMKTIKFAGLDNFKYFLSGKDLWWSGR